MGSAPNKGNPWFDYPKNLPRLFWPFLGVADYITVHSPRLYSNAHRRLQTRKLSASFLCAQEKSEGACNSHQPAPVRQVSYSLGDSRGLNQILAHFAFSTKIRKEEVRTKGARFPPGHSPPSLSDHPAIFLVPQEALHGRRRSSPPSAPRVASFLWPWGCWA